jgi:flagellar motility protein MotE (MotC chaperone)
MFKDHDQKFTDSQKLRIDALESYRDAGLALIELREALSSATKTNPVDTDLGVFRSFHELLSSDQVKIGRAAAYQAIKLAEHWSIVEALKMQDPDSEHCYKAMRLARTLKVIDWALQKMGNGAPLDSLSFDMYWQEEGESRRQRQQQARERNVANIDPSEHRELYARHVQVCKELDSAKQENNTLRERCKELERELARYKSAPPRSTFNPLVEFKMKHQDTLVTI